MTSPFLIKNRSGDMKFISIIILAVTASNITLAEEIALPIPAPSFMAQQVQKEPRFDKLRGLDLSGAKYCYQRGNKVTILSKKDGKFVAHFEITGVGEESEKKDIFTSQIDPNLAVAIIELWASWLSQATYQEEPNNPVPFYYAAVSLHENRFYEGVLPPLNQENLFAVEMNRLARKIDIHIKMLSDAAGSHNKLTKLPNISHEELKKMIDDSRTELLNEIKSMHARSVASKSD